MSKSRLLSSGLCVALASLAVAAGAHSQSGSSGSSSSNSRYSSGNAMSARPMAALGPMTLTRPRRLLRWIPPLMGGMQLLLLLRRGFGRHTPRKP